MFPAIRAAISSTYNAPTRIILKGEPVYVIGDHKYHAIQIDKYFKQQERLKLKAS